MSVFWEIVTIAHIYFRMSENSPVDNINRVENKGSPKLSCQIWQPSKLLVRGDLHTSLDELVRQVNSECKSEINFIISMILITVLIWDLSRESRGKVYLLPITIQEWKVYLYKFKERGLYHTFNVIMQRNTVGICFDSSSNERNY